MFLFGKSTSRKIIFSVAGCIILITAFSCNSPSLPHVDTVSIDSLSGTWYEVATLPNTYNKGCSCNKIELAKEESGRYVKMIYSCVKKEKQGAMLGKIFPDPKQGNAVWKEQYFWPFGSDYYVLALDENYTFTLVGSAEKEHFRILSRVAYPEKSLVDSLVQRAAEMGFSTKSVIYPAQDCR